MGNSNNKPEREATENLIKEFEILGNDKEEKLKCLYDKIHAMQKIRPELRDHTSFALNCISFLVKEGDQFVKFIRIIRNLTIHLDLECLESLEMYYVYKLH